jgi:phage-related protein
MWGERMDLFKLFGTIAIDNSDANESIEETTEKAGGFADGLKNGVKTVGKWGAAIGGATLAAGAAVVGFAKKAASNTDTVDKMSQKIGVSRTAYQELDFICSQSGTSVSTLQMGMKTLTAAMDGAKSGTKNNVEQFEKLGVAVTNSDGSLRSQEEVFFDTVNALQKMDNQTEKARLATELFGRSGSELMPLLNGAAGSVDEMRQQAHDLGLVLDDETIDAGVHLTDTIDQVERSFGAVVTQIGASVMPIVQQLLNWVLAHMPEIQAVLSAVFKVLNTVVTTAVQVVGKLYEKFESVFPAIKDFVSKAFTKIKEVWDTQLKPCFDAIKNFIMTVLWPAFQTVFNGFILPIVQNVFNGIINLWNNSLKPIFEGIITFLTGVFSGDWSMAWEGIKTILSGVWEGIKVIVQTAINHVKIVLSAAWNVIKAVASAAWNGIKALISTVWNGIKSVITTVVNAIKTFLSTAWNAIKTTASTIWNGIKTVITTVWNGIKTAVTTVVNAIKTVITTVWNAIKTAVTTAVNGTKTTVTTVWNAIKTAVTTVVNAIKTVITTVWNAIKTTVTTVVNGIKTTVTTVWNAIKTAVTTTVNGIKTTITTVWNGIKTTITTVMSGIKTGISTAWNNVKTTVSTAVNNVKTNVSTGFNNVKSTVTSKMSSIKSSISTAWSGIKSSISTSLSNIKTNVSTAFSNVVSTAQSKFNSVKSSISTAMSSAKTLVSNAISSIKGFFSGAHFSFPSIKLPHFSVSWSDFGPISLPHVSVSWYKKAMQNPYMLSDATIFGMNPKTGQALGGGEAGDEMIYGKRNLMNDIRESVRLEQTELAEKVDALTEMIEKLLNAILAAVVAGHSIVLDSGALVGELTPAIDGELGRIWERKDRG